MHVHVCVCMYSELKDSRWKFKVLAALQHPGDQAIRDSQKVPNDFVTVSCCLNTSSLKSLNL